MEGRRAEGAWGHERAAGGLTEGAWALLRTWVVAALLWDISG